MYGLNHILIAGIVLWLAGLLLAILIPAVAAIAVVMILFGKILTAIGAIVLAVELIRGLLG
jgi:hypothetical protein